MVDTLPRNRQFSPGPMAFSPDIDMNLAGQFTFAGQNELGQVRAETRDLGIEALLHNVYLQPFEPIQDLVYLAPKSGVATPSLALKRHRELVEGIADLRNHRAVTSENVEMARTIPRRLFGKIPVEPIGNVLAAPVAATGAGLLNASP